ncbi:MAG: hypothetical protein EXS37_06320 [Opitutus sp.]|nr:hypothetical protein [Opitutus sp.]
MKPARATGWRLVGTAMAIAGFALAAGAEDARPVFAEEFDSASLAPPWRARQGLWKVTAGVATGRKDPASVHPAKLDLLLPQCDGTLQFSFQTDQPGGVDLFFNRGDLRVAVVQLRPEGLAFATYPKTKAVPSTPTYLARSERGLAAGAWHAVRIERRGATLRVQADSGASLDVTGTGLEDETTTWMFNLRGPPEMAFSIDHVRVSSPP